MCLEDFNKRCIDCAKYKTCDIRFDKICPYTCIEDLVHNCVDFVSKTDSPSDDFDFTVQYGKHEPSH